MVVIGLALKAAATGLTAIVAASSAMNMYQTVSASKADTTFPQSIAQFQDASSQSVISELEGMKRRQLLEIFLACEAPKDSVQGPWDGVLLDNNIFVMTAVTDFLTNKLFGRGRKWNGKEFLTDSLGINRFIGKDGSIETEHNFDYKVVQSHLGSNKSSIKNEYWHHQFPLSLWSTMKDELRLVPCAEGKVMLGIGNMAWSGGLYNSSPFCLFRHSS